MTSQIPKTGRRPAGRPLDTPEKRAEKGVPRAQVAEVSQPARPASAAGKARNKSHRQHGG